MSRILLVDDEASILRGLGKRLAKMGHEVVTARDGVEALERFDPNAFDLVIADYRMPRMDGMELLEHVRRLAPCCPVVIITGTGSVDPRIFLERGAEACLIKPVSREVLESTLQRIL